ncbi:MAG: hypothetical protein GWN87_01475, partial [Desulfuromonadales bacterium]|nr:hypothetical protein [Desulfuromonadales bacterium]NIS39387.1 hypothetical protein [Desulfuromonadales bacterium]
MKSILTSLVMIISFPLFLLCAGSCQAGEKPSVRLLWPVPPNEAQFEFAGVFSSKNDFPRTKWQKILEAIFGKTPAPKLHHPKSIAVLPDGRILIAEKKARDLRVVDFAKRKVHYLFKSSLPLFGEPTDIALGAQEELYVADRQKGTVLAFDRNLTPLFRLSDQVRFKRIEKIALNRAEGIIYVSDSALSKVFAFDTAGRFLFEFGGQGAQHGQLSAPHGVAVNAEGEVFVADTGNARIEVYEPSGTYLRTFKPGNGATPSPLEKPWDVAFDSRGRLYIIDQGKIAFITCAADGEILIATGASRRSTHLMGFFRPSDIFIDRQGRVLITDDLNERFTTWQILTADYLADHPIRKEDIDQLLAYMEKLKKEQE